jgi:KaiC/GvpD/RAD55 family RecA-like ATPase
LKPEHFNSDKYLATIAKGFWLFNEKYGTFPDVNTYFEEVFNKRGQNIDLFASNPSPEHMDLLAQTFWGLGEIGDPPADYIADITLKVIKLASIHSILSKNRNELIAGTIDVDNLAQEIMDASSIAENQDIGINALENLEKRTEERLLYDPVTNVVPLVIPGISEYIEDGGMPRGTLSFFLAPTGVGKTTGLITITKTAILHNKRALYVSAELSAYEIMKRFDSAMTGVIKREVREKAEEVRKALMDNVRYRNAMRDLTVVETPMGVSTVKDVETIVRAHIKRHWTPDLLVIDYADNLAPVKSITNGLRMELHAIYRDLRGLGQKYGMAVWTASQTNDMGTAAAEDEKQNMSVRHANEARAKTHVADLIIGIARSAEEKKNGEARLVILKNRFGGHESEVVKIYPNFDCSLMWTSNSAPMGSIETAAPEFNTTGVEEPMSILDM